MYKLNYEDLVEKKTARYIQNHNDIFKDNSCKPFFLSFCFFKQIFLEQIIITLSNALTHFI